MEIRPLDLDRRRDVEQFVRFPFALYRGDPLWVPPLLASSRFDLDRRRHPTYRHCEVAAFLAQERRRTLGRILVMHNRNYVQYTGRLGAFFGYFECVEDVPTGVALFEAACDWARNRGLQEICGPRDLIGSSASGFLVEGFEHPPAMGVPYNKPYYDTIAKAAGFIKDSDHLSGHLRGDYQLAPRFYELAEKVKARRGLTVKGFTSKAEMRAWVPRVAQVYQEGFRGNYGYYPLTAEEFALAGEALIAIADPRLMKLVLRGEEVVGFLFAYPNINDGLRRAGGRLFPLGWAHILWSRRATRRLDVNGLGFLPSCQGVGGNVLLYTELARAAQGFRFTDADIVQVDEHNARSRAEMEAIGVQWTKRHRTYRRAL